jgi:hypothetical protein
MITSFDVFARATYYSADKILNFSDEHTKLLNIILRIDCRNIKDARSTLQHVSFFSCIMVEEMFKDGDAIDKLLQVSLHSNLAFCVPQI